MADTIVNLCWNPRRHVARDGLTHCNTVRAYRESPEGVVLQIRLIKEYVSCTLNFDEARQIAAALEAAVAGEG